jgi:hypothetical protein
MSGSNNWKDETMMMDWSNRSELDRLDSEMMLDLPNPLNEDHDSLFGGDDDEEGEAFFQELDKHGNYQEPSEIKKESSMESNGGFDSYAASNTIQQAGGKLSDHSQVPSFNEDQLKLTEAEMHPLAR